MERPAKRVITARPPSDAELIATVKAMYGPMQARASVEASNRAANMRFLPGDEDRAAREADAQAIEAERLAIREAERTEQYRELAEADEERQRRTVQELRETYNL